MLPTMDAAMPVAMAITISTIFRYEVQSAAHAQATRTVRVSWVVEGEGWCATVLDTVAAYTIPRRAVPS